MIEYIIVFNPNLREESYLSSYKPLRKTYHECAALRMNRNTILKATEILLGIGITFGIRQIDY